MNKLINFIFHLSHSPYSINKYTIKNNAKDAAFETRIRTYIDRGDNSETGSSKNNWVYNVIVKNISNETQNATVKINVPETLSIKNVEKMQMAVRQMKEKEHFLNHFFDARI